MSNLHLTAEYRRLMASETRQADWKAWGPYLSERAWGTVREDYSADGSAWTYFPHDHARSRAYRWNEDGLGGISNRFQNVCLAVGLWNEKDPILKERLFGVTGPQGNHGEDVKEYYFYLDSTPTHSYMKMLYKYPQVAFPYERLVEENAKRGKDDPEFELIDALREDFAAGRSKIWRIHPDGTGLEQLTFGAGEDLRPVWSPVIDKAWNGWGLMGIGGILWGIGYGKQVIGRWYTYE